MKEFYTYFLEKTILGGNFPIYYRLDENGGGPSFIKSLKDYNWPKVNSVMEMCSGPGFIGYWLKNKYNIQKLILVDKHEPLKDSIQKTNEANGWNDVSFFISDAFEQYDGESVDMIVSNPPHLASDEQWEDYITRVPGTQNYRILVDDGLDFHKKFLGKLSKHLNPNGYLALCENDEFITIQTLQNINPNLKLIDWFYTHKDVGLYFVIFQLSSNP